MAKDKFDLGDFLSENESEEDFTKPIQKLSDLRVKKPSKEKVPQDFQEEDIPEGIEVFDPDNMEEELHRNELLEDVPKEFQLSTQEAEQAAREDMDFFAGLLAPMVFKYLFPQFYKTIWLWLIDRAHKARDFSQLALGLPRGFGKTMVVKLFVAYIILFTKKRFILVIAGTAGKAENIIRDVISMLGERNVRGVFGNWDISVEKDRQDEKIFSFRGRKIILKGSGSDSDIRGVTVDNARPDVMIFDDIQTREEADSPEVSNKLEGWMYGTAMKAKSAEGCLFIFIANMYPTDWSLLKRIKKNPNWEKVIAGGILADGTSLWEELQPLSQLLKEFKNDEQSGRKEVFFAEVLNDENASVNKNLDVARIPKNPYGDKEIPQAQFVVIDPATDKPNADANSIGLVKVFDAKPVLWEISEGNFSPREVAKIAITKCLESGARVILCEDVAYQFVLAFYINEKIQELGIIGLTALPFSPGGGSKNSRIMKTFPMLMSGDFYIHNKAWSAYMDQATKFNPLKSNNTDGILDLTTMMVKAVAEKLPELESLGLVQSQEYNGSEEASLEQVCLF